MESDKDEIKALKESIKNLREKQAEQEKFLIESEIRQTRKLYLAMLSIFISLLIVMFYVFYNRLSEIRAQERRDAFSEMREEINKKREFEGKLTSALVHLVSVNQKGKLDCNHDKYQENPKELNKEKFKAAANLELLNSQTKALFNANIASKIEAFIKDQKNQNVCMAKSWREELDKPGGVTEIVDDMDKVVEVDKM